MKRLIVLTALLASFSLQLSAQTKKEKIVELFKLMKTDKMMVSMIDNMSKMFPKSSLGDPQKDSIYQAYSQKESLAFVKKLLDDNMVDLYDKYFTMEEIQFYINFYKTPEGQKMLDVSPSIQKDFIAKMMASDMPEFQERMKEKAEEIYGTK